MSPERWERRLAKRGLSVTCLEHGFGVGSHISRDHAVTSAIANLDQRINDLEREIAVLALAGKATK